MNLQWFECMPMGNGKRELGREPTSQCFWKSCSHTLPKPTLLIGERVESESGQQGGIGCFLFICRFDCFFLICLKRRACNLQSGGKRDIFSLKEKFQIIKRTLQNSVWKSLVYRSDNSINQNAHYSYTSISKMTEWKWSKSCSVIWAIVSCDRLVKIENSGTCLRGIFLLKSLV